MDNSDSGEGCLILVMLLFCCVGLFFYTDFSPKKGKTEKIETKEKLIPTIKVIDKDTIYTYKLKQKNEHSRIIRVLRQ